MIEVQVGEAVTYISASGRQWKAVVTTIPENPWHGFTDLPTVSLQFRNERNKLVRKVRVLPQTERYRRQVYVRKPKIE